MNPQGSKIKPPFNKFQDGIEQTFRHIISIADLRYNVSMAPEFTDNSSKNTPNTIDSNAPKDVREEFKNTAIRLREAGQIEEAYTRLLKVLEWDEHNNNVKGKVDILGHLRLCCALQGDQTKNPQEKLTWYEKSYEFVEMIKVTIDKHPDIFNEGNRAIQYTHLASATIALAAYKSGEERTKMLVTSLELIDQAIDNLPGTTAHKAWPANIKAKILIEMGKIAEAEKLLFQALGWISEGYADEIAKDDQAEMKLSVWQTGIMLSLANIYKTSKHILAISWATAVLNTPDPANNLGVRKREAQEIIDSLDFKK